MAAALSRVVPNADSRMILEFARDKLRKPAASDSSADSAAPCVAKSESRSLTRARWRSVLGPKSDYSLPFRLSTAEHRRGPVDGLRAGTSISRTIESLFRCQRISVSGFTTVRASRQAIRQIVSGKLLPIYEEHYGLDSLVEYRTETIPDAVSVVNPQWRTLDSQIRSKTG